MKNYINVLANAGQAIGITEIAHDFVGAR